VPHTRLGNGACSMTGQTYSPVGTTAADATLWGGRVAAVTCPAIDSPPPFPNDISAINSTSASCLSLNDGGELQRLCRSVDCSYWHVNVLKPRHNKLNEDDNHQLYSMLRILVSYESMSLPSYV